MEAGGNCSLTNLKSTRYIAAQTLTPPIKGSISYVEGDDIMETQAAQKVHDEIVAQIRSQRGAYSSWYAGIASDWEDRLFNEHQVPRQGHWYIARQCYNDTEARAVEKALLQLGCDGGRGGGDPTTVFVYAYLKGTMTNP